MSTGRADSDSRSRGSDTFNEHEKPSLSGYLRASIKSQSINAARKEEMRPVDEELKPLMEWAQTFMEHNNLEAVEVGDGLYLRRYTGRDRLAALNPEMVAHSMHRAESEEEDITKLMKTLRNRQNAKRRAELREYCEAVERGEDAEPPASSTIEQVESFKRRRANAKAKSTLS